MAPSTEAGSAASAQARPALARAQWAIGLLMAASAAVLALRARLPFPYRDDWDWFRWLLDASSVSSYFIPHNEHVVPLARLLLQAQYGLEGSNGYTMLVASLLAVGLIAWITVAEVGRRWPGDPAARHAAGGAALVILGFAWQLQSVVFPAAVLFPLVQLFAVVSIICLLNASEQTGVQTATRRRTWLALAGLSAVAAMLTTTNGLPVPVLLALVAAGRRMGKATALGFSALAALGAGLYIVFVLGGQRAAAGSLEIAPIGLAIGFFLAFYASLVALVTAAGSVMLGALLFAAGLFAVVTTWLRRDRPRIEHFAVGILLFTMASAALAAPTRASLGIVQAAQSRYASFVQPYWAALLLVGASRLSAGQRRAWQVPVLAASVAVLPVQGVIGAVWAAKADNTAVAGLALRSGGGDEEWMATLYPEPGTPPAVAAALVADGDRSLGMPLPQLSTGSVSSARRCEGEASISGVPRGSGLRLRASLALAQGEALVLDRAGASVGVAAPSPAADGPNPAPMDVARAVWRRVWRPTAGLRTWMGFAATGGGGPYTLVPLDATRTAVCRLEATGP